MFDISLSTEVPEELEDGVSAVYGSIQIGDFRESFIASLSFWSPEQYRRQWQEAAQRLADGEPKSAFVTSFAPPSHAEYFVWWPCYRSGESVYLQNQLRFYKQIRSPFLVDALYRYVADRKTVSDDDGEPISEWQLPLQSMREFLQRNRSQS